MRVGLVVAPFVSVPPRGYGGTELFVAGLAEGLSKLGHDVLVYTNGESTVAAEKRWIYPHSKWPISNDAEATLRELEHTTWAVRDASQQCAVIHVNSLQGVACSRFADVPFVHTIHHPQEPNLSDFYQRHPCIQYVTISDFQRKRESLPKITTIHHGIDLSRYKLGQGKREYLSFLGRIAPIKGPHLAVAVAKRAGIPLKIAGEVQPLFRDYFETQLKPHIDGKFIEYVGVADLSAKNELLGDSLAMLFPIQWDEPFGLVLIESMACGAPVLALPGGSVSEIVQNGVSGYVCNSIKELAFRAVNLGLFPAAIRHYVKERFSVDRMAAQYCHLYEELVTGTVAGLDSASAKTGWTERDTGKLQQKRPN